MLILSLPTCVHRACLNASVLFITHTSQRAGVYVHSLILVSSFCSRTLYSSCTDIPADASFPLPLTFKQLIYVTMMTANVHRCTSVTCSTVPSNGWCIILGTRRRYESIQVNKPLKARKQSSSQWYRTELALVSLLSAIGYLRSIFCCLLPVVLFFLFVFCSLGWDRIHEVSVLQRDSRIHHTRGLITNISIYTNIDIYIVVQGLSQHPHNYL
jgi:hypothetical protein